MRSEMSEATKRAIRKAIQQEITYARALEMTWLRGRSPRLAAERRAAWERARAGVLRLCALLTPEG